MNKGRNQKKRYGLLLIFLVLNWLVVGWMVWKVDPNSIKNFIIPGIYLPMLIAVFGAMFLLFSILFLSAKRALRWAVGFVFFILLRVLGLGSTLNGLLILGLLISIEIYSFKFRNENAKEVDLKEVVEL